MQIATEIETNNIQTVCVRCAAESHAGVSMPSRGV